MILAPATMNRTQILEWLGWSAQRILRLWLSQWRGDTWWCYRRSALATTRWSC